MEKMYNYLRKVLRNEQKFSPKKILDLDPDDADATAKLARCLILLSLDKSET